MRALVKGAASKAGGYRALAEQWGISHGYVGLLVNGGRPVTDDTSADMFTAN